MREKAGVKGQSKKRGNDAKKSGGVQNGGEKTGNGVGNGVKAEVKKQANKQPVLYIPKTNESPLHGTYSSIPTLCGFYVSDRMDLPFELLLFIYSVVHLVVQNYNIYRTNFLDVDYYAFSFSLVALFRRLIWKQAQAAFVQWSDALERSGGFKRRTASSILNVNKPGFNKLLACSILLLLLLGISVYCGLVLASRHQSLKLFIVVVPVAMYFGAASRLQQDPPEKCLRLEWATDDEPVKEDKVLHIVLSRNMFSSLWRGVLYAAFFNAYYVGVIPVLFVANEHLYWPPVRTRLLTVVVFLNTLLLLSARSLYQNFLEYVAYTHTYGHWQLCVSPVQDLHGREIQIWRPGVAYKSGTLVRFHPGLVPTDGTDASSVKVDEKLLATAAIYKGLGYTNCGVPGDLAHAVAWTLFSSPYKTQACLTLGQLAISLALLFVAVQSVAWYAVCIMLLFNYLFLFIFLQAKRSTQKNKMVQTVTSRLTSP